MKLLIVDDEELTRAGLIQTIDWNSLGIDELLEAENGEIGLAKALEEKPDIVLCDVRMPKMNGIDMLTKLEESNPNIVAIFMSGYSDKEYLMAAIKLKAINYIEKPIEPQELIQTIQRAIEQCNRLKLQAGINVTHENQLASSLAYYFTMPYTANHEEINKLLTSFSAHYGKNKFKYVTSFIVKLKNVPENPESIPQIFDALHGYLLGMHLHVIYTEKRVYHIVFHIYGELEPGKSTIRMISDKISQLVCGLGEFYISVGKIVCGEKEVYNSYQDAVIKMQNCFFYEIGTIITDDVLAQSKTVNVNEVKSLIEKSNEAIVEQDEPRIARLHNELFSLLNGCGGILPNQIKSLYYELFQAISRERATKQMVTDIALLDTDNIIDIVDNCFSIGQLNQLLVQRTKAYFADVRANSSENPTIRMIREYINMNYGDPSLSVKSISEYANLSVSYACTYFKSETGITLNQYITDYRIKKAKQLLVDPRIKVNEVSAAVGYNDGNYFAKIFRKATGLSPSEYREQVIRS